MIQSEIGSKWIFSIFWVGYQETFTPVAKLNTVAKLNSVRVLLSHAANLDRKLLTQECFLNGDLEEVYMDLLSGFDEAKDHGKVCKLEKSLHGLKQSPQA